MDRTIWKAKNVTDGEWVEGNLVHTLDVDKDFMYIIILKTNNNMYTTPDYVDLCFEKYDIIDPSTLCQCTGVKDKNGKLIFEGDELKHDNVMVMKFLVYYEDACFKLGLKPLYETDLSSVEVVGSKYDEVK